MGQVETKIFEDSAPPWDERDVVAMTDLDEKTIDVCWRMWASDPLVHHSKLKEEGFYQLLDISADSAEDLAQAKRLFELLDRDDDQRLEFCDTMLFLFSMEEEELSAEQKLKRSFHLYDRTESGKISKREMVETLDLLGLHEMEHDKNGKVVIPDPVENLFSLMDFDHDGKVSQPDFLRTTMHYRKLEKYLTIDLLERGRRGVQEKIRDMEAMIREEELSEKEGKAKKRNKQSGGSRANSKEQNDEVDDVADELGEVAIEPHIE